jgi:serine/threonine protein kinase
VSVRKAKRSESTLPTFFDLLTLSHLSIPSLLHFQEQPAASIDAMSFKNFCGFWSLTSAFLPNGDVAAPDSAFAALVGLFESWSSRVAPLSGTAKVLRIAWVAEQLAGAIAALTHGGQDLALAQLDELEHKTAAAESAAQAFRQAHEALAETILQTLEAESNALPCSRVQARDAAFGELQEALQQLDTCSERIDLATVQTTVRAHLAPLETALANLSELTDVDIPAALDADPPADDDGDMAAINQCCGTLRLAATGVVQQVKKSAAAAQQLAGHFIARDGGRMLETASDLQNALSALFALKTAGGNTGSIAAVLRDATPWDAILRCSARLLAPLRGVGERFGYIKTRAAALRSEVDALASGFVVRAEIVCRLEETHKTMKRVRKSYMQLKLDHDDHSDGDSDAADLNAEELSRQRHAFRVATRNRDKAARELFLAAKAYHPETLVEQHTRLRLTGVSALWSERTLDEYDERRPLACKDESRYNMVLAKHEGSACILKLVHLLERQALCKETEILRRLDHPNIVKLQAAFVESDFLYLHFPYARHGDLEQYLVVQAGMSADTCVSAEQLRRMARQLCEAVAYLAERNIVHCNIKPANVFVDEETHGSGAPIAILGDFDVRHTAAGRTATLTMAMQKRGFAAHLSAGYVAPEVVRAPSGQPPRTTNKLDVFALGCVIYHMHMYPRVLPEPKTVNDDVASRAGLFEQERAGTLPECAIAAWARIIPRDVIVGATHANPTARLTPRGLLQTKYMRFADGEFARVAVQRPVHWQYQEHAGTWFVRESTQVVAQVEKLLNDTAETEDHGIGRNCQGGRFGRFRVTSVQRVENSQVWSEYASRRRALADTLAGEGYALPEQARHLATASFQYPMEGGTLEAAAGEVFLFHGTSRPELIASSGFDVRSAYADAGAGAMFGRGVYFSESASTSDQRVQPSAGGKLTLVLARVCLGRCSHSRRDLPYALPEVEGMSTPAVPVYYNSILTEMPGMRYREVVIGRDTSAYPELFVEYERV